MKYGYREYGLLKSVFFHGNREARGICMTSQAGVDVKKYVVRVQKCYG